MTKKLLAMALAATTMIGTAQAHPTSPGGRAISSGQRSPVVADIDSTGSIAGRISVPGRDLDAAGRDLRSSTRGNVDFPERSEEAQNLGSTAGGPSY